GQGIWRADRLREPQLRGGALDRKRRPQGARPVHCRPEGQYRRGPQRGAGVSGAERLVGRPRQAGFSQYQVPDHQGAALTPAERIAEFLTAVKIAFGEGALIRLKLGGYHGAEADLRGVEIRKIAVKGGDK